MRKRSAYRPKGVIQDTMAWIKQGMPLVSATKHNTALRVKNHDAMAAMVKGQATREDVDTLIHATNTAVAMSVMGIGAEYLDAVTAGQLAVRTMRDRGEHRDRFLFTGAELTAANIAMEVHDAQLDAATVKEMEQALDLVAEILAKQRKAQKVVA